MEGDQAQSQAQTGRCSPAVAKHVPLMFRVANIGLCVFMCATAIDSLSNESSESDTDAIFVALYVFLFAVMLFVFEAMSFLPKPIAYVDAVYRANFGFMYKPVTKAVFLVFVGFLQFGLDSSHSNALGLSCGILTISSGILMAVVYCKDTSIFDAPGEKYTPPAIPPVGSDQASV